MTVLSSAIWGPGMRSNAYELCRKAGFEPKVLYEGI